MSDKKISITALLSAFFIFSISYAGIISSKALAFEEVMITHVPAGKYRFDLDHSHIYWKVSHAGYSMTHGRFNKFDGSLMLDPAHPGKSTLEVRIDMSSVDTNVPALDADLATERMFDTENHPEAAFTFESVEMFSNTEGKITGSLSMKGVTKPVTLDVVLNDTTERPREPRFTRMGFSASGEINRLDWGVDVFPDIIGHMVTLTIDVEFLLDV